MYGSKAVSSDVGKLYGFLGRSPSLNNSGEANFLIKMGMLSFTMIN